jgi:hypothetical protein
LAEAGRAANRVGNRELRILSPVSRGFTRFQWVGWNSRVLLASTVPNCIV